MEPKAPVDSGTAGSALAPTTSSGLLKSKRTAETSKDEAPTAENPFESFLFNIQEALKKTVQGIVDVGKLLKQAKDELDASYKQLEEMLPFSSSTATNFIKIAEHPVLSNPDYWVKLPPTLSALYYLSMVDQVTLVERIESGEVTPEITLARAKALRNITPNAAPAEGEQTDTVREEQVQVVISVPASADRKTFLEDLNKLNEKHRGVVDHRKSKAAVGEWFRENCAEFAKYRIEETQEQLSNIGIDQLRKLETATTYLTKSRGGSDLRLPDDYPDHAELAELLRQTEITSKVIKKWCKEQAVPTQLALSGVAQEVYVWEQLLLVAEKQQDAKSARKRLETILRKNRNRAISQAAKDALDKVAEFENS